MASRGIRELPRPRPAEVHPNIQWIEGDLEYSTPQVAETARAIASSDVNDCQSESTSHHPCARELHRKCKTPTHHHDKEPIHTLIRSVNDGRIEDEMRGSWWRSRRRTRSLIRCEERMGSRAIRPTRRYRPPTTESSHLTDFPQTSAMPQQRHSTSPNPSI